MVAGEVSKFVGNADGLSKTDSLQYGLVAFCSKPWKLEAVLEMWKESCIDDPGCLGDPCASSMTGDGCRCCLDDREKIREREVWRALVTLSLYQANCDIALIFSWYSA